MDWNCSMSLLDSGYVVTKIYVLPWKIAGVQASQMYSGLTTLPH